MLSQRGDHWSVINHHLKLRSVEEILLEKHFFSKKQFFKTPKIKKIQSNKPDHGQYRRMWDNMSAGHFHMFWEWSNISSYWLDVKTGNGYKKSHQKALIG